MLNLAGCNRLGFTANCAECKGVHLVPLTDPMKPSKVASSVVWGLYQDKKISWARVFEEVIEQVTLDQVTK
jgi:hypothetical protein